LLWLNNSEFSGGIGANSKPQNFRACPAGVRNPLAETGTARICVTKSACGGDTDETIGRALLWLVVFAPFFARAN
jgi:hypothetical protein